GDKVEMITETGRVVTGPVSSLATTKDGVSSRVDYVTSTGNPEFTFELPVNFADTNLNLKLLTARTHTYGEDGVCTECGYHEDIKSNCYVLTGTAKTGGVSIPAKSTINLNDSSTSKTYTAYVASVNDQTSGTVTVAEGEQLSVVVSISGAYNLTSSDYLYLTNQKLWVSRFYNDMDATIVPSQTKTFFLDGITAHAVDNNTGKYYRDDFMGEEVSRSTVISTAPEKNATAWFEITGTPTIGTAGASVSVTLNKGDISIGDSFNVYSSEGKLLNGPLVSCKVAAIQVGSKTTTTLANGQTGILVLKAVNAAAQSPRDQDVTSTYIKKGIYCAF
ncbi:MAG: hypothetical protein MJ238_06815, partial [Bacilli bacterium]|nr:hypothetical protein [Bacilli bacterium]